MSDRLFNVKLPPDLWDLVERAAAASGLGSKSAWAREALEAGARKELAAYGRRVTRGLGSTLGGGYQAPAGGCAHPVTARRQGPTVVTCSICRAVVRYKVAPGDPRGR